MKKYLLGLIAAFMCLGSVTAQETVKTLYTGSKAVTWESTLTIPADEFNEGVNVGDFISISLSDATDVLEIKGNGTWLPGSRFTNIAGAGEYRAYITVDMLAALKAFGMEICGASFTVTAVEIKNDGFEMPEGAIWGGFFWVENWNTLELWKTAFDSYAGERYLNVYLEAGYDYYVLNVLTKWDVEDAKWTRGDNTLKTARVATVDLEGIDVKAALADVNALMIQLNPEGGEGFNVTAVTLTNENVAGVNDAVVTADDTITVYNLQGIAVRTGVNSAEALQDLPAGIYIQGGKKYMVK